ncbi:MAG: DUF2975 domain-containing protein [Brevundimonas sp.]|uniref:DUF2975 domain-containing protein n=1 Tax=Brevundimonas sp. TaxID=1871086 RepID=UPI00182A4E7D|nr:DUF2975 domain-containing protein [Brevundimonas sp.]MBA4805130.1 DUF2975 domain-containing protein [Brevundimonas sp.]
MRLPKPASFGIRLTALRAPALPGLGPGPMSRLLGVALGAAFWALALAACAFFIALVFAAFVPLGPLGVTVTAEDGGTSVPVPRAYILFGLGAIIGYLGGFAFILRNLRAMVHTLRIGDPFHPDNVQRLRQIGLVLATVTGGAWIGQTLVSRLVRGALEPPSPFDLVTPAFSVLVVFVLAQVFREGARLRREAELTI